MVTVITCTGTGNISSFLVVNANGGGGGGGSLKRERGVSLINFLLQKGRSLLERVELIEKRGCVNRGVQY